MPLTGISPSCYFLAATKKKVMICPRPEKGRPAQSIVPWHSASLKVLSNSPALPESLPSNNQAERASYCSTGLGNERRNVSRSEVWKF